MVEKVYVTYNQVSSFSCSQGDKFIGADISCMQIQVHKLCQSAAQRILNDFKPNLMIAIGGGGYVPARILRYTFLIGPERQHSKPYAC